MNLADIREQIDNIDRQLTDLLVQRCELAWKTAHLKNGIRDTEREQAVLDRISSSDSDPVLAAAIRCIYRSIITECVKIQHLSGTHNDSSEHPQET